MRLICRLLVVICAGLTWLPAGLAQSQKRVALVIGNADYKVGPLQNPTNDALAVAEVLQKKLKFDKVLLRQNLGFEALRAALMELSREAVGADVGLVYFAGHGTEVNGRNFLIPVDAKLTKAGDLELEAVALDAVLTQLAGVTKLKLVVLDACRNNIFPLAGGKRSVTRGLGRIEPEENTLVVYAAKDGTTAEDGKGKHSPFTDALLAHIATPGLEINFVFRRVRDDVVAATNSVQYPHIYGTLGGKEFYLRVATSDVEREWAQVDKSSVSELETFVGRHPASTEADYARSRIEELKKRTIALAVPAPASLPKAPDAPPKGQFDGVWNVTGAGGSECYNKTWSYEVRIEGKVLFSPDGSKGTVTADGKFNYTFKRKADTRPRPGTYTGKLSAGKGTGRYEHYSVCVGSLVLRKLN